MKAELPEGGITEPDNAKVEKFGHIEYTCNDVRQHEKGLLL
jgi:hypothetical protein